MASRATRRGDRRHGTVPRCATCRWMSRRLRAAHERSHLEIETLASWLVPTRRHPRRGVWIVQNVSAMASLTFLARALLIPLVVLSGSSACVGGGGGQETRPSTSQASRGCDFAPMGPL